MVAIANGQVKGFFMRTLAEDLKNPKSNLRDFKQTADRVLDYLPAVITDEIKYLDYNLCSSTIAGMNKRIRPFNNNLFLRDKNLFGNEYESFFAILQRLKNGERQFNDNECGIVDRVVYTLQQALGIGLDLVVESNSSRKHVGNRFEELIKTLLIEMKIPARKIVLNIPYDTDEGVKYYRCETDIIVSPFERVRSNSQNIDPREVVISLKTTTKDRMPKIFIDKILMEKFVGHPIRIVGISLNDIQRQENKTSYTFISNLFMVYTRFLTKLDGYYYLDIPLKARGEPFRQHIFPFSKFIIEDIWKLFDS